MTILEEKAASQKTSSTSSRKSVSEDDNRNHLDKGGIVGSSEINVNRRNSINLDETLIRALTTSNSSAMISAVGDRYITPEYLAPLPSSSVSYQKFKILILFVQIINLKMLISFTLLCKCCYNESAIFFGHSCVDT